MDVTHSYYEILNVAPKATRSEIRESYIRLKNTFNQQNQALYSLMSDEELAAQTAQIEEAFQILNDDVKRRKYDQELGLGVETTGGMQSMAPQYNAGAQTAGNALEGAYFDKSHQDEFRPVSDKSFTNDQANAANLFSGTVAEPVKSQARVVSRQTRAERAGDAEIQQQMQALIAESDVGDGALYLKLRELVGVTEVELQERTKICIEYIRAIETNTYERLPRTVFVKGFLRSYMKYLGVPEGERLVSAFAERLDHWHHSHKART